MSALAALPDREFALNSAGAGPWRTPVGEYAEQLRRAMIDAVARFVPPSQFTEHAPQAKSLRDMLYEVRASCKTNTSRVAMHLDQEWRERFFRQIDNLFDEESWDPGDQLITEDSFRTFLRMVLYLGGRRPGIGASTDGNFIAMWSKDGDHLTVECKPADRVRWIVTRHINGARESAAGETILTRLPDVLAPYNPERWFGDDGKKAI